MEQKTTILVLVASLVLLVAGALVFAKPQQEENSEEIILAEKVKGNPEAAVVLSEYSDFECPACGSFATVVSRLVEEHGDKFKMEYHHFPLVSIHRSSEAAARAAEAAGVQGKFWEMHDVLFDRQNEWAQNLNPNNKFKEYAEELGLDVDQFERNMNNTAIREVVKAEMKKGTELGITGTPSFFIDGEKVDMSGFQTYEDFVNMIEIAIGVAEPAEEVPDVEFSF